MRPRRISISTSDLGLAALAAGLLAFRHGPPPAADVRPAVALAIDVRGQQLEPLLGPSCGPLRKGLTDSLQALLDRHFSFLRWESSGSTTLRAEWRQRDSHPRDVQLLLSMRGPGIAGQPTDTLDFEEWTTLIQRPRCPRALGEWTERLDSLMETRRNKLVALVFGQVPLDLGTPETRIRFFTAQDLAVRIDLRRDEIRAADIPPEFRLNVLVDDPTPPASQGDGVLELKGCLLTREKTGYSCQMAGFTYRQQTTTAEARRAILQRASLSPKSLHLLTYQPATFATGANGTIAP